MSDYDETIRLTREAIGNTSADSSQRARNLSNLGVYLHRRYKQAKNPLDYSLADSKFSAQLPSPSNELQVGIETLSDLDEAIRVTKEASQVVLANSPDRARILSSLGQYLQDRYKATKSSSNIEEAIRVMRTAIELTPEAPQRAKYLISLGNFLHDRYSSMRRTVPAAALEEAIRITQIASAITPEVPDQATALAWLGFYLYDRYHWSTRNASDLEEAIRVTQIAVNTSLGTSSDRALFLYRAGFYLAEKYSVTEDVADLEEAIQATQEAADITTRGQPYRIKILVCLASSVNSKYLRTQDMSDLDYATRILWMAFDETPVDSPSRLDILHRLHSQVYRKFVETNDVEDLEDLIRLDRSVANSTPEDDQYRPDYLARLGVHLRKRYSITGKTANLEEAIHFTQAAIDSPVGSNSSRERISKQLKAFCRELSMETRTRSSLIGAAIQQTRAVIEASRNEFQDKTDNLMSFMAHLDELCLVAEDLEEIEKVIGATQAAIDATPMHHPNRVILYKHLADHLLERSDWTDDVSDLHEAIRLLRVAINIAPKDHVYLSAISASLRACMDRRYTLTESAGDLEDAIEFLRTAVDTEAEDNLIQSKILFVLGRYLWDKYRITKAMGDLEEAIISTRDALSISKRDKEKWKILKNLAALLHLKYQRTHALADLEDAIHFAQTSIDEISIKLYRAGCLNNLGILLKARYERTDSLDDLDKAIQLTREAIEDTLRGPNRPTYFHSLGSHLCDRFIRTGTMSNLEEAIRVAHTAVDISPTEHPDQKHPERATFLSTLGYSLHLRYLEIEVKSDLEEAILVMQEAVDITPQDSSDKTIFLNSLSVYLIARFRRTGEKSDLDEAVAIAHASVDAAPNGHPDRVMVLQNLGRRLYDLYAKTGLLDVLEKAINVTREALTLASGVLEHALVMDGLGLLLAERFEKTGDSIDLDEAIRVTRLAVDSIPEGLQRSRSLQNLALHLRNRSAKMQTMDDLSEASHAAEKAVKGTPEDHPDRAKMWRSLGSILEEIFSRSNEARDLHRAISCYQFALRQANANLVIRIEASIDVLRCCALNSGWEEAYEALDVAVGLVPMLTLRSLQNADKQYLLSQVVGLASDAAAMAFNAAKAPDVALRLLEQGRGLLAASLEEMRTDLLVLREKHPDLAEEFAHLQGELNLQSTSEKSYYPRDRQSQSRFHIRTSQPYQADRAFDQLLVEIRNRPGFTNFLSPPNKDELQAAANSGPIIVINVSEYRCDAILVEQSQIRILALPGLKGSEVDERILQDNLGSLDVLSWLWEVVAKPVLDALGYNHGPLPGDWPHVWWIPTGALSRFPLHAAGRHDEDLGETVLDRVMSSYSSSVKAIINGRRRPALEVAPSNPAQALLVAMKNTPRFTPLNFADTEVAILHEICKAIPLNPINPGQLRHDIIAQLPTCSIFHFAGHGYTDGVDPSQSHLVVHDDKITVATLLEMNLRERSPFLAYLSACGTGQIKDDRFLDESIHLISACQLAGFRHVIGTLWEVNDELCVEMARVTYEGIRDGGMTDEAVCLGLHKASQKLRENWLKARVEVHSGKIGDSTAVINQAQTEITSPRSGRASNPSLPRDIVLSIEDNQTREDRPLWIPYVHFGV